MSLTLLPSLELPRIDYERESFSALRELVVELIEPNASYLCSLGKTWNTGRKPEVVAGGNFVANNLKPFVKPFDSVLTNLAREVIIDKSRFVETTFDLINGGRLAWKIGQDSPVTPCTVPTEIFKRLRAKTKDGWELVATNSLDDTLGHLQILIRRDGINYWQTVMAPTDVWSDQSFVLTISELAKKEPADQDEEYGRLAIYASLVAAEKGLYPFGAVIVGRDGKIVVARNNTNEESQPGNHAELLALHKFDVGKAGSTLFASTEPCHSCAQSIIEGTTGITRVKYTLKKPSLMWSGRELLNLGGVAEKGTHQVQVNQMTQLIPEALRVIEASESLSEMFRETVEFNRQLLNL